MARPNSIENLTGQRFGRLIVIRETDERRGGKRVWECLCDCGRTTRVITANLTRDGGTHSCGCLRSDRNKEHVLDLTGQRFGRLVVTHRLDQPGRAMWVCQCDCGNTTDVRGYHLRSGGITSCGCYRRDHMKTHGYAPGNKRSDGQHPLYSTWRGMRQRCNNPNHDSYARYGAKGVTICEAWNDFAQFLADVGDRPPDPADWDSDRAYYTLDRIDPTGNYEPSNVRWADPETQTANTRNSKPEDWQQIKTEYKTEAA